MLLDTPGVDAALEGLDGWTGDTRGIRRELRFADFAAAMRFVNRVAEAAEERNHHPDIAISYNRVTLEVVSHSAGGVTDACVDLARAVDGIAGGQR